MMSTALDKKYQHLREIIGRYDRVLVAFSGGVDSTLVLKVALDVLGAEKVLACLGKSALLAEDQCAQAMALAQQLGATLEVVERKEMANPEFLANVPQRCYICKVDIFRQLVEMARQRGCDAIVCGSNVDDLGDYRPGNKAAPEFGIKCPLEEAGLTKAEIRQLSQQLHLPTWNKPSDPCLATRLAYGLTITPERLKQVESGEAFLRRVVKQLGGDVNTVSLRMRHHGDLVRIEVPVNFMAGFINDDTRKNIVTHFKDLGFTYVTLDLQGFRSGSGNETLSIR